jgi:hypothetical protein
LLFYSSKPQELARAYWSQTLTTYSILLSAALSVAVGTLSKFHALVAIELVASPMTLYMTIYALRSLAANNHRLHHLLRQENWVYLVLNIATFILWVIFIFYVCLVRGHFAQASCSDPVISGNAVWFTPSLKMFFQDFRSFIAVAASMYTAIFALWVIAMYRRRDEVKAIWYNVGRRRLDTLWTLWCAPIVRCPY